MLLKTLHSPIRVFDVSAFGASLEQMQRNLRPAYATAYGVDDYLHRQTKLELIEAALAGIGQMLPPRAKLAYYAGDLGDDDLIQTCASEVVDLAPLVTSVRPTRSRCVSEYVLERNGSWRVTRVPARPFAQPAARVAEEGALDYRQVTRRFDELPDELVDSDLLAIIEGVAAMVHRQHADLRRFTLVAHHTLIRAYSSQDATNSPEGIHQDGMDYIVSAIVLERSCIRGGTSIVFGADRTTPILEMELQAGQGILQPDEGSDLWHRVTSIEPEEGHDQGFRSTLGLDIRLDPGNL